MRLLILLLIPLCCIPLLIGESIIENATAPTYEVIVIDEFNEVYVYTVNDTSNYRTSTNTVTIKRIQP